MTFEEVCGRVKSAMEDRWKAADEAGRMLRKKKKKRAIMGYEEAMEEY